MSNYQSTTYYSCYIDNDGNIIGQPYGGYGSNSIPSKIGVTESVYQSLETDRTYLQETCERYYEKLVELGVFPKVKSTDEIISEQGELIKKQSALLESVMEKLAKLTDSNQGAKDNVDEHIENI